MIFGSRLPVFLAAFLVLSVPFAGQAERAGVPLIRVQEEASVGRVSAALRIDEVVDVMRAEGTEYGGQMEAELFPGKGGQAWADIVDLIYDRATMRGRFDAAFAEALAGHEDEFAEMARFFESETGQHILTLEIEARRSLMDEAVEDAAKVRVDEMAAAGEARYQDLQRFAEINDLVESNISGALNSNLAFFQGMAEVGALAEDMTEEDMLADVWSQEPEIRAETEDWVYPYLALAYGPLSEEEMADYIRFSETGPGQTLNSALFTAFDRVFASISRDLGRAAARQMMGEDI